MAILDHLGLNRYVYMSSSIDTMTLGSTTLSDIKNTSHSTIIGAALDDTRLLLGINLYNNGPYGHSSWQQLRVSENPLSRHMRETNQFSIVENGKEITMESNGKRVAAFKRHGDTLALDEPAVVSAYKPMFIIGTIDGYDQFGRPKEETFRKRVSYNNDTAFFTNDQINDIANIEEKSDQVYESLKGYYLENALEDESSPMNSFERLAFRQNIYPPQQYTYKSYTRARTNFTFNWRDSLANRQQINVSNNFGLTVLSSSIWNLDVDPDWQDFPLPLVQHLGKAYNAPPETVISSSFGILWNHYSQFAYELLVTGSLKDPGNSKLSPGPIYARRHSLYLKESVVGPTGQIKLRRANDI